MNNQCVFWDNKYKRFLHKTCGVLSDGSIAIFKEGHLSCIFYEGEITPYKSTGLMAINNKMIYADSSIVEFDMLREDGGKDSIMGVFTWNDMELRYEIDIPKKFDPYVCLLYDRRKMCNFKVIGTVQEKPEILRSGEWKI